jgi:hypothetical protein
MGSKLGKLDKLKLLKRCHRGLYCVGYMDVKDDLKQSIT